MKSVHGTVVIKWILYADDLVLVCPNISQVQDIVRAMDPNEQGALIYFRILKKIQTFFEPSFINLTKLSSIRCIFFLKILDLPLVIIR